MLEDGRPDFNKGSFYANPEHDQPTADPVLVALYPSYCRPNIWPDKDLPSLRQAFREMGQLIISVGTLLARRCDGGRALSAAFSERTPAATCVERLTLPAAGYVRRRFQGAHVSMERIIAESPCCKARLLHYYPPAAAAHQDGDTDGRCGVCHSCCLSAPHPP